MPVRLTVQHGPHRGLPRLEVLRRARAISRALQLTDTELSIVLTSDDQIRKLNATYRRLDAPTDVLAFAMREGDGGHLHAHLLGDVIVSVDTARAQATRAGRETLSEVTMLIAHGVLHLLGWDHDTKAKDRRMRAETERLCRLAEQRPTRRAASPSRAGGPRRSDIARRTSAPKGGK